jgi:uncharacterized circularly permuted ATP-grasp superfamily protein
MSNVNISKLYHFDEMFDNFFKPNECYKEYFKWLKSEDLKNLKKKQIESNEFFKKTGITFSVYGNLEAEERIIPFDIIPRVISEKKWMFISKGIKQRVKAINYFLHDIYNQQEIIKAGILPLELIKNNNSFLNEMIGFTPPGGIFTHIVGIDLVRTPNEDFVVLEDNTRTPSGVSYMVENRQTMLQMFPELFDKIKIKNVTNYPISLLRSLKECCPKKNDSKQVIAILTPGPHNSAYFEHSFLADEMGIELVEGNDLKIKDKKVSMRTTQGYKPIDIIYRRVDDYFLDPLTFNPKSILGVPGLMDVYKSGNLTIANAPGSGIADDKAIYSYIPDIINFYTGEKPLLKNVKTWRCSEKNHLKYVLDNLDSLVVKEVHGSGGYGMLIGPKSTKKKIESFRKKIISNPDKYIAQPTLELSTVPVLTNKGLSSRHVDLRPFILVSPKSINITPGGLTRVALKDGSLVVNSSQGGGTKDTWVLEDF